MGPAHWQTPDDRIAAAPRGPGVDHGSAIELRLYLPRRAWHFTFTRKRAAAVEFRGIVQTDADLEQVAAPSVL
jgi:hypothetical protein